MKTSFTVAVCVLLSIGTAARAHRLDEYLQATIISLDRNRLHAEIRLTPGVAVFPAVMREIDTNADGTISPAEQRAYAGAVLRDMSFAIDGTRLSPRLAAIRFPAIDDMKEGRGEIQLEVDADLPRNGRHRKLTFENRHEFRMAAYLVNCLVPRDPDIQIVSQSRNYSQSSYELDFVNTGADAGLRIPRVLPAFREWAPVTLLLPAWIAWLWRRARAARATAVAWFIRHSPL